MMLFLFLCLFADEPVALQQNLSVIATRTQHDLQDVPGAVTLISEAELRYQLGQANLADVLRDVPGLEVVDLSVPGGKRISIRGEQGTRVLVLIDGMRVSEQKSMDGAPLLIPLGDIQSIEILKGPGSVLYGSDAMGGVIHIHTKKASLEKLSGSLDASYNSSAQGTTGNLSLSGTKADWTYRVSASDTNFGDRKTPTGTLDHSGYTYRGYSVLVGRTFDAVALEGIWEYFDGAMESASIDVTPPLTEFFIDLPEWSREKVGLALTSTREQGALIRFQGNLFQQNTYKDFVNDMAFQFAPGLPPSTLHIQTQNDLDTFGASFQTDWVFGANHTISLGVETSQDQLDAIEIQDQIGFGPPLFLNYDYRAKLDQWAVFAQDEWNLNPVWEAYLGVRQTWVNYALQETDNPALVPSQSDQSHAVGNLGLVAKSGPWRFRGQAAQGYRYGTLQQLFIGTSHGSSTPTLPNPELKPESSNNYEIGARFSNSQWDLDLTAFSQRSSDYITTRAASGYRLYDNIDKAESTGLEGLVKIRLLHDQLTVSSSWTWMKREYTTQVGKSDLTGIPDWYGRIGLTYNKKLARQTLHAETYLRSASDAEEKTEGDVLHYDGWTTLNASFGLEMGTRAQYRVQISGENLTDKTYQVASESLIAPGRHFILSAGIQF